MTATDWTLMEELIYIVHVFWMYIRIIHRSYRFVPPYHRNPTVYAT